MVFFTYRLQINLYGWLGDYDLGIENNGELLSDKHPSHVNYISAKSLLDNLEQVMVADDNLTFNATFIIPNEPPKCVEPDSEDSNIILEIALGVLSAIILLLITVLICTCCWIQKHKIKEPKK